MLKRLHIRNYALIDELEIQFSDKLTIITGETGAGKSILLGALGLVMGDRADSKVFYRESEKIVVEAWFEVAAYDLREFFEENELDYDTEVVIRREISAAGKSRAFVNDTPVNNNVLKRLTDVLLDLHQQFDTLDIHNINFQLRMVDALADNSLILKGYQQNFRQFAADKKRLAELVERSQNGEREMDFLKFQFEELAAANLATGEQDALENELQRLTNAEDIKRTFGTSAHHLLESEQSIVGQLQALARSMSSARRFGSDASSLAERMEAIVVDLQELAKDCDRLAEGTEHDPARIAEVNERLNIMYKLLKKHNLAAVDELLALQGNLEKQLGSFADLGEAIADLEQKIGEQEQVLRKIAAQLSERRRAVTADFEEKVQAMLTQLSMPHARLKVEVRPLENLTSTGLDDVEFLFATNVGSKFLPIKDVASGGELSRLTLCAKSLVADAIPLPTLIFDEIDTGISGDVSLKMGLILKDLAARHQVVSITHTPQIAARADSHYFVYKKIVEDKTVTNVRLLSHEERVRSLAVMLSGNPPSDAALATARELIG